MLVSRYWLLDAKGKWWRNRISYKKLKIWQLAHELVIDIH